MDPDEIHDWIQSLDGVVQRSGKEGAKEILEAIEQRAKELRVSTSLCLTHLIEIRSH